MLRAAGLALADLALPAVLRVLLLSLGLTLLIFMGLGILLGWALGGSDPCDMVRAGSCPLGAVEGGISALLLTVIGFWFLFPAVAIGVVTAFSDRIVVAVEARHYPEALASARETGWLELAAIGLASAGRLILFNLIALPAYLLLIVTGIGPLILFLAINGLVIGRDLWAIVAVRHLARAPRRELLAATRLTRFGLGVAVTVLFMIPLVNLIAPVLGAAMATHLFHGTWRTGSGR